MLLSEFILVYQSCESLSVFITTAHYYVRSSLTRQHSGVIEDTPADTRQLRSLSGSTFAGWKTINHSKQRLMSAFEGGATCQLDRPVKTKVLPSIAESFWIVYFKNNTEESFTTHQLQLGRPSRQLGLQRSFWKVLGFDFWLNTKKITCQPRCKHVGIF